MPRRKTQPRTEPEYTETILLLDGFDGHASAAVNSYFYANPALPFDDSVEPVFDYRTELEIRATCIAPHKRSGDHYTITLHSEPPDSHDLRLKMKDMHEHDEDRCPVYRQYRGHEYPVYRAPKGLSVLHKIRGEPRWTSWITVSEPMMSHSLALLSLERKIWLVIDEVRREHQRWIRSLYLRTSNPDEEE